MWSERYDREVTDVFAIQDEIGEAIAAALRVRLAPRARGSTIDAPGMPRVDPEAYDAYLKGRYFFNRPSDENLQHAIARFEEALALAPDFVPALSGLSDAYLRAGFNEGFISASGAKPRARAAAEEAIRLDARSAEAHTSLAVFKLFYECDWEGGEAEFRRALVEVEALRQASPGGRVTPFDGALVAIGLGDHARAVSLLEQAHAMDSQWLGWLRNDRIFDPLRSDPRFRALLKKLP